MRSNELRKLYLSVLLVILTTSAIAQQFPPSANGGSFMVQCPATTITHPTALPSGWSQPLYNGPTHIELTGYQLATATTLAAWSSCSIGVVFAPATTDTTLPNPKTATMNINDNATNAPQQLSLTCWLR